MSTSRSGRLNTCPPCTKLWTVWKTSRTTRRHIYWSSSARTKRAGEAEGHATLYQQRQSCLHPLLIPLCVPVRVPPFALLHGTSDIIVPVESSTKFSELLNSLSVKVSLYLLPRVDHTEIVTDLMAPGRCFYHPIYSCIKQEYRKLLGTCWHTPGHQKHTHTH